MGVYRDQKPCGGGGEALALVDPREAWGHSEGWVSKIRGTPAVRSCWGKTTTVFCRERISKGRPIRKGDYSPQPTQPTCLEGFGLEGRPKKKGGPSRGGFLPAFVKCFPPHRPVFCLFKKSCFHQKSGDCWALLGPSAALSLGNQPH